MKASGGWIYRWYVAGGNGRAVAMVFVPEVHK